MINFDFETYMNITKEEKEEYRDRVDSIRKTIYKKEELLDWVDVETCIEKEELKRLKKVAKKVRDSADVLIVIGIGGSYLGTKAIYDMFNGYFSVGKPEIIFAGFNMSSDYLRDLLAYIKNKSVYVNVVSKSGTTLEPSVAFDVILKELNKRYSKEELKERIIATTDKEKGTLKELADREGYTTFVVPDNIGGRYSVLTPVGLFPLEVAGISASKLLKGAKIAKKYEDNAIEYAIIRDILYKQGKVVESYTVYEPKLYYFTEWLKQLFGETQGKGGKAIFPVSLVNTRDLHSLGQYLQEGNPIMFESVLVLNNMPKFKLDNYKDDLSAINVIISDRVAKAHNNGHTPSLIFNIEKLDEEHVGMLVYLFEFAAAVGGYLLDVNPFDQPGVSEYKKLVNEALEVK